MKTEFSSLGVHGFRRLSNLDLSLTPMNVLIGANAILRGNELSVASAKCPELKALLNTLLSLCDADRLV